MTQASKKLSDHAPDQEAGGQDRLRSIIRTCTDIPPQVREARFTRVDERVIDASLLRILAEHDVPGGNDKAQAARRGRRAATLSPYLGKVLVCVLIMLPGVSYTIEINMEEERVVHWEWQPG